MPLRTWLSSNTRLVLQGGMPAKTRRAAGRSSRRRSSRRRGTRDWSHPVHRRGIRCTAPDTLFLATSIAFDRILVQCADRVVRAAPDKDLAEVHDYHDRAVPLLAGALRRRMPGYRASSSPADCDIQRLDQEWVLFCTCCSVIVCQPAAGRRRLRLSRRPSWLRWARRLGARWPRLGCPHVRCPTWSTLGPATANSRDTSTPTIRASAWPLGSGSAGQSRSRRRMRTHRYRRSGG